MNHLKKTVCLLLVSLGGIANAQPFAPQSASLSAIAPKTKAADAQILDARSAEEFAQNHLSGAINVNPSAPDHQKDIDKLSKEKPTFIYSIGSGRSGALAKTLKTQGFKEVIVLPGGIANWIGSGFPIVNNTKKGVSLSLAQFKKLTESSNAVLVDFGSKYCGACKKLSPVLDSLETNVAFGARIIRLEAYDNTELLKALKINQLPTLVLYEHKKEVWKKSGQSTATEITAAVAQHKTELAKSH